MKTQSSPTSSATISGQDWLRLAVRLLRQFRKSPVPAAIVPATEVGFLGDRATAVKNARRGRQFKVTLRDISPPIWRGTPEVYTHGSGSSQRDAVNRRSIVPKLDGKGNTAQKESQVIQ